MMQLTKTKKQREKQRHGIQEMGAPPREEVEKKIPGYWLMEELTHLNMLRRDFHACRRISESINNYVQTGT